MTRSGLLTECYFVICCCYCIFASKKIKLSMNSINKLKFH